MSSSVSSSEAVQGSCYQIQNNLLSSGTSESGEFFVLKNIFGRWRLGPKVGKGLGRDEGHYFAIMHSLS